MTADASTMRVALALLAALLLVGPAQAAESLRGVRAEGFRVGVPPDWRTIKNVGSVKLLAIAPRPESGFSPNLNVVVTGNRTGSIENLRRELRRDLPKAGIKVSTITIRTVRLPAGRAFEVRYRGTMLGRRLAWLAYVLEARGRSYVLTFTARTASRHAALFRAMARSFRFR